MIHSMTAFARHAEEHDWGTAVWEVRSINHRYLEPSFKLPENCRALEHKLREKLRSQLNRGKVECSLKLQFQTSKQSLGLSINSELLGEVIKVSESLQRELRDSAALNPLELLKWPGVVQEFEPDSGAMTEQVLAGFQVALEQLLDCRQREGDALLQFTQQRLAAISDITAAIRKEIPQILQAQREKLTERLAHLLEEMDLERIEQEMVMLAQKADVDEELDRLDAHVAEVNRVLQKGGPCGRRLDFLMQELNREANTLSSKSIVTGTTQAAVELKVLIEQMREQIQNIE